MTTTRETTRGRPLNTPEPSGEGPHIKVVLGKMRFDAHDVGARYIMRRLVDAGMEVVFIRFALVSELVDAALQEDAHVIGLSSLTGGHLSVAKDLVDAVKEAGLEDRLIVIGGVIADQDVSALNALGIDGVFGPGSKPEGVIAFIQERVEVDA
jgi:methylmalonyl-CoA mutase, C-terminal domain